MDGSRQSAFTGHGGRLEAAMAAWPQAPKPWADLSTGINPWPYPAPRATRAERSRLPDPERIAALESTAARAFGVADPARVLATAGAEAALRRLPEIVGGETVWVKAPTYASHAAAWTAAGRRLVTAPDGADVAVVVNPNNPDGALETPETLRQRADLAAARGGWLVVDESFIETLARASVAPLQHPRIVILRSFGKFYGLAGLRLGFVIGDPDLIRRLRAHQGDWPVSADAIAAGLAAYADDAWADRTRARLARRAAALDRALLRSGLEVVGGTSLFRLARAADVQTRFAALCAAGILTRPFADQPDWLRFGLPTATVLRRLDTVLTKFGSPT